MHDLVVRGGTVVDGTGRPAFTADVAIDGGRITTVGRAEEGAAETIDADGLIVTPGFVDPHTHYDGQATWDPLLTPSCWHGVTTAVLGNCGVGFAPVQPERREWLVQLMEGVEDIPGTALHEGIRWAWESFPEYLDALGTMPRAIDIAAQLPHGALRAYVMGERGAANEPATAADVAEMARLADAAARAGAVGFSTNRLPSHRAKDGRPVPGTYAADDEMLAIAGALHGAVVEIVSSEAMGGVPDGFRRDVDLAERISTTAGAPVTFCLNQVDTAPDQWREVLGWIGAADARGARIVPQVAGRPLGLLLGLTTKHVFAGRPSFEEVAGLPLPALVRALADPERRRRILAEPVGPGLPTFATRLADKAFALHDPPDYEPEPVTSVGATARRTGRSVEDVYYDLLLEDEGQRLVLFALGGYAYGNAEHVREMLSHPLSVLGLADGGAHVALICDASAPTSVLSYFVRDRTRGARLPLELAVQKLTSGPAGLYGFTDRGVLAPGRKADVNVIDFAHLALDPPRVAHDLPTGARRLLQRARGYVATVVAGEVVLADGADTGRRPGRLVRRAVPR
jgi:N-acyl-D-aspartate/D-glutamate deacylase